MYLMTIITLYIYSAKYGPLVLPENYPGTSAKIPSIAGVDQLLAAVEADSPIHHFHLDHLGTPRLITDQAGNRVAFHSYYPFGQEVTDPEQSPFSLKFTGHERDENGDVPKGVLDSMKARTAVRFWGGS
jgi:RHS protein